MDLSDYNDDNTNYYDDHNGQDLHYTFFLSDDDDDKYNDNHDIQQYLHEIFWLF